MIRYRSRWLRYAEVWFDQDGPVDDVDIVYRYRSSRSHGAPSETVFHTLVVDLTKSESDLLAGFDRRTRRHLRTSQVRDDLIYEFMPRPDAAALKEFFDFYDEFTTLKALNPIGRARIECQLRAGQLALSRVKQGSDTLVWHSYMIVGTYAMLEYSASHYRNQSSDFRNLVGRANRRHHLWDMLALKSAGIVDFDLGGWYPGNDDAEKLNINRFKEQFGGQRRSLYDVIEYRTPRAHAIKWVGGLWSAFRGLLNARHHGILPMSWRPGI